MTERPDEHCLDSILHDDNDRNIFMLPRLSAFISIITRAHVIRKFGLVE